ncbi:hypothetical protein E2562_007267 [Oryza meyeriana var. granulata]|uniref:Uncharacterized protein n=1 Tax=Oryza meyeriana var. granulata TaxID=110450 RepID=A0A6G1CEF2_9ORYZ|nr:hypothetical protein E2562_007267 [Oryza meyeriana var. granulata]
MAQPSSIMLRSIFDEMKASPRLQDAHLHSSTSLSEASTSFWTFLASPPSPSYTAAAAMGIATGDAVPLLRRHGMVALEVLAVGCRNHRYYCLDWELLRGVWGSEAVGDGQ